ncbi:MAG: class V lanthionine synthetase subunit LxmK [Trebonia sp.]
MKEILASGGGTVTEAEELCPGALDPPASADMLPGRNQNWTVCSGSGPRYFVKRFTGPPADARPRMCRALNFERVCAPRMAEISPRILVRDEASLLLAYELIEHAATGADLIAETADGADFAARAGRVIGSLHALGAGEALGNLLPDDVPPALPSAELLRGLPLSLFRNCSAGELKAWRLMQEDALLAGAVDRLLAQSEKAPRVPAHCDLRLDQFMVTPDRLYVIDWEEFRLADAARDVGSFAGECVYHAVTGWAEPGSALDSDEDVMQHCVSGIEQARLTIAAFWSAYRAAAHVDDPGLTARSTAFAGWHMFDRMLASARHSVRLSAIQRAAAGIGRGMMTAPADAAATIGLAPE